jgi:flagellar protein FlaG
MEVGKILSSSPLLQRSEGVESVAATRREGSDAEREPISVLKDTKEREKYLTSEQTKELTDALNKFLEPTHSALKFEFHEKLEEYYVTIVDTETQEVIKEIPPKKMLDIYAAMAEFIGIIVDKKI